MLERTNALREESGNVTYSDPLTTFIYLLLRDHLPAGVVEGIVREVVSGEDECLFTNGWLAKYSNNLSDMIKNTKQIQLEKALEQAFSEKEKARIKEMQDAVEEAKKVPKEEIEDDVLSKLEEKLKEVESGHEEIKKAAEVTARAAELMEGALKDEQHEEFTTIDDAREMVTKLQAEGHIKPEDAERLQEELDEVEEENVEELAEDIKGLEEDLEVVKNGEVVSNAEWCKDHATYVDVDPVDTEVTEEDVEKWKNTHEELQKIEKEDKTEDEE